MSARMADGDPLIDWQQLDMIADGYTEDFVDIYREFAADLPRIFGELHNAIDSGDSNAVARAAHQTKGSAANFGFLSVTIRMAEIEASAKAGSIIGAAEKLADAEPLFQRSLQEVKSQRVI
jgi:HPt (histidine-containing phosphotransfer) domain-containing protein